MFAFSSIHVAFIVVIAELIVQRVESCPSDCLSLSLSLSVCVCVNQSDATHNRCTRRFVIVRALTYTDEL